MHEGKPPSPNDVQPKRMTSTEFSKLDPQAVLSGPVQVDFPGMGGGDGMVATFHNNVNGITINSSSSKPITDAFSSRGQEPAQTSSSSSFEVGVKTGQSQDQRPQVVNLGTTGKPRVDALKDGGYRISGPGFGDFIVGDLAQVTVDGQPLVVPPPEAPKTDNVRPEPKPVSAPSSDTAQPRENPWATAQNLPPQLFSESPAVQTGVPTPESAPQSQNEVLSKLLSLQEATNIALIEEYATKKLGPVQNQENWKAASEKNTPAWQQVENCINSLATLESPSPSLESIISSLGFLAQEGFQWPITKGENSSFRTAGQLRDQVMAARAEAAKGSLAQPDAVKVSSLFDLDLKVAAVLSDRQKFPVRAILSDKRINAFNDYLKTRKKP